jgi:hypothetical protein
MTLVVRRDQSAFHGCFIGHGWFEDQEDGIDEDAQHSRGGNGGQAAGEDSLQERDGQESALDTRCCRRCLRP